MAIVDDTKPERTGPGLLVQIGLLAVLTLAAVGIGWLAGMYMTGRTPLAAENEAQEDETPEAARLSQENAGRGVIYLEPVMTNLAGPVEMWARLEAALVFDGEPDPDVAQSIQHDFLAYMRTVKSHQVEGASGFQHLRSDLEERASLRSDGRVTRVLIRALLFE